MNKKICKLYLKIMSNIYEGTELENFSGKNRSKYYNNNNNNNSNNNNNNSNNNNSSKSNNKSIRGSVSIYNNTSSSSISPISNPIKNNIPKKVGSTFNFSNFKLNKIKNNIKVGVNIGSKSSVIVNIKDIIGKFRKPFDINYISYFKGIINTNFQIRELKKQNYLNMNMFYIDNFKNYPDKYLAYIYYNYKDFYFIYDYDKKDTKLYDIGDLEHFDIEYLFNDKIQELRAINFPTVNNTIQTQIHSQKQTRIHNQNFHHGNNSHPSYKGTSDPW